MKPQPKPKEIRTRAQPRCYVCGAEGVPLYQGLTDRWYGTLGNWNIKMCPGPRCGMAWLDPMPLEEDIGLAYLNYYTHGQADDHGGARPPERAPYARFLKRMIRLVFPWRLQSFLERGFLAQAFGYSHHATMFQRIAGHSTHLLPRAVPHLSRNVCHLPFVHGGRLLDIGCGSGAYLEKMRDMGWDVEGLEVDRQAVAEARRRGLRVRSTNLQSAGFDEGRFDAVVLTHVLEHVHEPGGLLRECQRILRAGGIIRAIVPNIASYGHRRFKAGWPGLDPPRHLYHFTVASLRELGIRAGFSVEIATSSAWAEHVCERNAVLAGQHAPTAAHTLLFGLWESVGVILGRCCGEEIVLKGTKLDA